MTSTTTTTTTAAAATSDNNVHATYYNLPPPSLDTPQCCNAASSSTTSLINHPSDSTTCLLEHVAVTTGTCRRGSTSSLVDQQQQQRQSYRNDDVVITIGSDVDASTTTQRVFEIVYTWKLVEEHGNVFQLDQMGILDRNWPADEVYKLLNIRNEWKSISTRNRMLYDRARKRLEHHLLLTRDAHLDIPTVFYFIKHQFFDKSQRDTVDLSPFLHHICFFIDVVNRDRVYFEILTRLGTIQFYNQQSQRQHYRRRSGAGGGGILQAILGFVRW